MRPALVVFVKALRQQLRDRLGLLLTVLTAPAFVCVYWVFASEAAAPQRVVVMVPRAGEGVDAQRGLLRALRLARDPTGQAMFDARDVADESGLARALRTDDAAAGVALRGQDDAGSWTVEVWGDTTARSYARVIQPLSRALQRWAERRSGHAPTLRLVTRSVGVAPGGSGLDGYVPGLLVFAVILLVFSSSMALVREIERGMLVRLSLTAVRPVQFLLGTSAVQLLLGLLSVLLTFGCAALLGFRARGSLALLLVITSTASLATLGMGLVVASLARSALHAFLISSTVMFMLVLLSGIIFPRPEADLFVVGSQAVGLFDLLPTTHMAVALRRVLGLGASLEEVRFELTLLSVSSLIYITAGALLYRRQWAKAQ